MLGCLFNQCYQQLSLRSRIMTIAVFFLFTSIFSYFHNTHILLIYFLILLLSLKFRYFLVLTKTSLKTEYKFVLREICAQRRMMQKVNISATSGLPTQATEYLPSSWNYIYVNCSQLFLWLWNSEKQLDTYLIRNT